MRKQSFQNRIFFALTVLAAAVLAWILSSAVPYQLQPPVQPENRPAAPVSLPVEQEQTSRPDEVLLMVPFTAQAPLAQWGDVRYQNACEEAAILMAWHWLTGDKTLNAQGATAAIADIVAFEQARYGFFIDSSAADTARLVRDYYGYEQVSVSENVSVESIRTELASGNLVIVPVNGRLLGNPNFTPPGPERHMVLIKGYDDAREVFLTNDPGTRNGESFEYGYDVLLNSVRDYLTGDHVPIPLSQKAMIVVKAKPFSLE